MGDPFQTTGASMGLDRRSDPGHENWLPTREVCVPTPIGPAAPQEAVEYGGFFGLTPNVVAGVAEVVLTGIGSIDQRGGDGTAE